MNAEQLISHYLFEKMPIEPPEKGKGDIKEPGELDGYPGAKGVNLKKSKFDKLAQGTKVKSTIKKSKEAPAVGGDERDDEQLP